MYNRIIKFSLIAILLALAAYQFVEVNIGNGIMFLILAGLVILSLFKHELVLLGFYFIRKGKFDKAERILLKINHPEKLPRSQEAYYYYLRGLILSQRNLNHSEKFFRKALSTGLRMKHDRAMAKLNLAGVAMTRRRKREAVNLINECKKLDKHGMLSDQIKMMQQQVKRI